MLCGKGNDNVDHDQISLCGNDDRQISLYGNDDVDSVEFTFVLPQAALLQPPPLDANEPSLPSLRPAAATEKKKKRLLLRHTFATSAAGWRLPRPFVPISSTLPKPLPEAAPVRNDEKEFDHNWHSFLSSLFYVRRTPRRPPFPPPPPLLSPGRQRSLSVRAVVLFSAARPAGARNVPLPPRAPSSAHRLA
jgi:hypothetical protein